MNFLKSAASAASAAASKAAESAKKTYADLKALPTQVRCSACPTEVDVPPTAFDWTCGAGHVNKRTDELCVQCKLSPPSDLPDPTVTCPSCQALTVVPSSNARKHVRETAVKTKEAAVAAAVATKAGVDHLRAAPTTFHCAHCNTLLAVPTGPWACQTCTTENLEEIKACKQCGQKKSDQKAICGVCRQSTVIPATNFADGFKHTVKDLHQSSKKVYFDVAGKPYLTCNKCQAHISVPPAKVTQNAAAGGEAVAPGGHAPPVQEGPGASSAPSAGSSAPGGASPADVQVQVEGTYNGDTVVCTNCKNPIEN